MMFESKLFVLSAFIAIASVSSSDYSYDETKINGPSKWGRVNPNCDGLTQSPIDLSLNSGVPVFASSAFVINDIDKRPSSIGFSNAGYGIVVNFTYPDGKQPTITGGPLFGNTYVLDHLHLHFRSEHTVNKISFDAEAHLVHYNSKYKSLNEALNYPDGLAVLGVLFYNAPAIPVAGRRSLFNGIFQAKLLNKQFIEQTKIFSLLDVLGRRTFSLWSYEGSLTTPGCNEVVTWMVHKVPIPMSPEELNALRQIQDADGKVMTKYNRPVQPLNGRIVLSFF